MPIIFKERNSTRVFEVNNPMVNLITEDPRPGHNVIYLGSQYQAYDSITLKPILGVNGTFIALSNYNYGAGSVILDGCYSNGSRNAFTYMKLAGANPTGFGKRRWETATANTTTAIQAMGQMSNAWQMDSSFPSTEAVYKDFGDGSSQCYFISGYHNPMHFNQYCSIVQYNLRDDQELYEVMPVNYNDNTGNPNTGPLIGFSNTDGTHTGLYYISSYATSYYAYSRGMAVHQYNSTTNAESAYGPAGANDYIMQSVGISRADGLPIILERWGGPYSTYFKIAKWSGTAYTALLSNHNTGQNESPFDSPNANYAGNGYQEHGAGLDDSYLNLASQWTKMNGSTSKYLFMFYPEWDANHRVHLHCIRWDTNTDTFVGAGMQGVSTQYTGMYHRAANSYSNYHTYLDSYTYTPYESGNLTDDQATGQRGIHSTWADVHGYANRYGDSETYWDAESQTWQDNPVTTELQPISIFQATGMDGFDGGDANYRRILCGYTDSQNGDTCYYYNLTGISTVPEMPYDWVWLNSGKTVIAAVCKNNTYIYQCRKGDSLLDEGDASGSPWLPTDESFNADIHDASATAMGWVHTATIPFQVIQIGTDKHDRVWYVTWEAESNMNGITTNLSQYAKQLWMMTDQTPFRVNLTGNATTDTITYSGSNIDKTLTIEALNFKGQKIAKNITLNITGSDARFDNASQTKNITTSATTTVNETITITGSGSFNITATFGA